MKSVLMIAYYFPPDGSAGVYRSLRFVRHLPALGWSVRVLAADMDRVGYGRYDPGLVDSIPDGTEVVRVRGYDAWRKFQLWRAARSGEHSRPQAGDGKESLNSPGRLRPYIRSFVQKAEAWYYWPDTSQAWIRPATEAALKICRSRARPNVIWATGKPWSSFIVAQRVSQETGIPYVLDFRSPWTLVPDEKELLQNKRLHKRSQAALDGLLRQAQAAVFFYRAEAESFWRAYPGALQESNIHVIPNGYEGQIEDSKPARGDKCSILYAGNLVSYRYDTLLRAISDLKNSHPAEAKLLDIHFVGEGTGELARDVVRLAIGDIVRITGAVTQLEIAALHRKAHVLLVLGRPYTLKGHELLAGAKLFGYLKECRPIMGILPNDQTKSILRELGVTTVADVDSVREIAEKFLKLIEAWSTGNLDALVPSRSACSAFSAESQTIALDRALSGKQAVQAFVPGSIEVPPSLRGDSKR